MERAATLLAGDGEQSDSGEEFESDRLGVGSTGEQVAALHEALVAIGLNIDDAERDERSFGASTAAAVTKLQAVTGFAPTGVVDEKTSATISRAMDRLGLPLRDGGRTGLHKPYSVAGTVTDADGNPLAHGKVVAFDCELRASKPIGETQTDHAGAYHITYRASELYEGHTAADLRVELHDDAGQTLFSSPITFNAPRHAPIDLALGGPAHTRPSEFSSITTAVVPLLGPLPATELEQSSQHQDLSFLAGQTAISLDRIAYWAVAARMSVSTELPGELFYGLLRCAVPANAHVTVLASSSSGVDLAVNAQTLLNGVLSTSTTTINHAVATAVTTNLIPASYATRSAGDVAKLETHATSAALTSTLGFAKTSFASVLNAVAIPSDVQQRFIELYTAAPAPGGAKFWKDLASNPDFTAQDVSTLRFGVVVGRFTRGYLPLINELAAQRSTGRINHASDLARLTVADWTALIQKQQTDGTPIGVPAFFDAGTPQLAQQRYASMLERVFTSAYPTTAFSARIAADNKTPFAEAAATAAFLDANPSFDLRRHNLDAFGATTAIPTAIRPTLLAAQRLIKIHSDYTVMSALMADGVHSAQQIYLMGPQRFAATYGSLPALGATAAARTWARAEQTYGVALALAMKFNAQLGAASPAAIGPVVPQDAKSQTAGFPNLQTLFGPDSFCACQDCQSVLGDPAYLVDILQFLNQRDATPGSNTTAASILLDRRPDLQYIQLNCPNTNTALPYIDLVNELLEAYITPGDPYADPNVRQTTLTTPELNANPEWLNQTAYDNQHLAGAVYPWTLPFDLHLREARTYLGQLNLSRAQLIRTFQAPTGFPSPQADELAREQLGLSALQADIITGGPLANFSSSPDYWGLAQQGNNIVDPDDPTKTITGSWIDVLTQVRVLLARAGLQYQDLAHLLNTIFVNGAGTVSITANPPDSCDVSTMTLTGLTQDVLDRIHRVVRLWRCLGWDPYDLDNAIMSLQTTTATGLAQLNNQLLRQLACVSAAMQTYSLSVASAVALFAPTPTSVTIATRQIPTLPGDDPVYSLYHDLFENLTILNPPDPIFALNPQGQIAALATSPPPQLTDHAPTLVAAFQISRSDLNIAIEAFTDGNLTLSNLSALYRNTLLATGLGITITQLISLLAIAEMPIPTAPHYEAISPFDATGPESLAAFARAYAMITASGLSIEQIDYLLRGVDSGTGVAPDPVAVGTMLLSLHGGLAKIAAASAFPPDGDPTGAKTRKALATLLDNADVNTAMAILGGTSTLPTTAPLGQDSQDSFVATVLGAFMDPVAAQTNLVGATALAPGQLRYEYVLYNVLNYLVTTASTHLIVATLAKQLGLTTQVAALLLSWFPSGTNPPGQNLLADFLALPTPANTSEPLTPTTPSIPPASAPFAPYFSSYAALAKAALLITTLKLGVDDVTWWRGPSSGVGVGLLDPTTLPNDPTHPAASAGGRFYRLARLITAANVRRNVPIPKATFETLFTPAADPALTKSEYLDQLAKLTRWPLPTLSALCGKDDATHGELALKYPDDYISEIALSRVLACEAIISQTGIPADVTSWISDTVDGSAADAIKQSVKANYPEQQWLTLAKELRDPLRQAQRDALVAYILAGPPPAGVSRWLDPDDVFGYFLIDVEMCSCMATSRMVQATAAVQLFVLRCFLGLEPGVTVDLNADSFWGQWQWMSQYRVWEANREVFLWPENWLEPTLRHDASPFFTDLMQDLKKGDLTADTATTALQNYLEKLEAVARLDVCGYFHDLEDGKDVLRVVARTQGSPPIYYSRTWVDSSKWTAWEKVAVDIASDHVLPLVWNGKHYIFWAITTVKGDQHNQGIPPPQTGNTPPPPPNSHLEVQLAWSQYKHGKWQAKQVAPQTLVFSGAWPSGASLQSGPGLPGLPLTKASFESADITLKSSFVGRQLQIDVFTEAANSMELDQ
jgi:hypothetical protein